jgi:phosphotransferase system HPr-like phosphotransfer protein
VCGTSIMGLMMLGAPRATASRSARRATAPSSRRALAELVENKFGEE